MIPECNNAVLSTAFDNAELHADEDTMEAKRRNPATDTVEPADDGTTTGSVYTTTPLTTTAATDTKVARTPPNTGYTARQKPLNTQRHDSRTQEETAKQEDGTEDKVQEQWTQLPDDVGDSDAINAKLSEPPTTTFNELPTARRSTPLAERLFDMLGSPLL